MNICGKFIEIASLSTEISRHTNKTSVNRRSDNGRTDGLTEGRPENIMPPLPVLGRGIKIPAFSYYNDSP